MLEEKWLNGLRNAGLLCFMAAVTNVAAAGNCLNSEITWQTAGITNASQWDEYNAIGRKLVHESGTLRGAQLSAAYQCNRWIYQTQLSQLSGSRLYEGQTSLGVPVNSNSNLQQTKTHFQANWLVTDDWQIGARIENNSTSRDILSAGGASGYPERFDWTTLSVGAHWAIDLGPGKLMLGALAGKSISSQLSVTLPGKDESKVALGSIKQFELSSGWSMPIGPSWTLQADLGYRLTNIAKSNEFVVRRSGAAVGIAHQPRLNVVDMPVAIRIGYKF